MLHFIKYNIIGLMNTLLTLVVVYVLYQLLAWNLELSNFLGFVAGGINSYVWNRKWNFKSNNKKGTEIVRFLCVFAVAYAVNLGVLELSNYLLAGAAIFDSEVSFLGGTKIGEIMKPGYVANIAANVAYVIVSFGAFKFWVFKNR